MFTEGKEFIDEFGVGADRHCRSLPRHLRMEVVRVFTVAGRPFTYPGGCNLSFESRDQKALALLEPRTGCGRARIPTGIQQRCGFGEWLGPARSGKLGVVPGPDLSTNVPAE